MKLSLILYTSLVLSLILGVPVLYAQGLGNCDNSHNLKTEGESLVTDSNVRWVKAIIKAGSQNQGEACFEFTEDANNDCYLVSGLGTDTAHATKVGDGPDCKDISHVEWFSEELSTLPTPQPTVYPVPSIDPSPISSPSATPSATPQSSVIPSPTPSTGSDSVEKQMEKVMEEVKKESPQILGVMSFK